MSSRRWKRAAVWFGAVVAVFVLVGWLASLVHFQDPTEGSERTQVMNDTPSAVRLAECVDARCAHLAHQEVTVRPREALSLTVQPNVQAPILVRSGTPARSSCVRLLVGDEVRPVYRLTSLPPCSAGVASSTVQPR